MNLDVEPVTHSLPQRELEFRRQVLGTHGQSYIKLHQKMKVFVARPCCNLALNFITIYKYFASHVREEENAYKGLVGKP